MSVVTVRSAGLVGVDAQPIDVEVSRTRSLPGVKTVGLPDATLREGQQRVLLALSNSGLLEARPSAVVNLAPAELRKTGAAYELPIALGLLAVSDRLPASGLAGLLVVGELSLHGELRPVRGALAMAALARRLGMRAILLPAANAREASLVGELTVYAAAHLRALVAALRGEEPLEPYVAGSEPVAATVSSCADLADVRGQLQARRAAEVAAAGGHHLLFVGPPGSGKTMIARRLPGLLPELTVEEAIESTAVASVAGLLPPGAGLLRQRPFRAPHHTISAAGLVGGYAPPRPGELSLAHNGVLFLDEMSEFSRRSLESLREPLEEGRIRVLRAGLTAVFPARAVLVGATNPCPCGYFGDPGRTCACPLGEIDRYRRQLSGPLLDRIDLHVDVPRVRVEELTSECAGETSAAVAARVARARDRQRQRLGQTGARTNAELNDAALRQLVPLRSEERRALERAVERLTLSPRAFTRILKVARTVADLGGVEEVRLPHLLEAIQYRSLDRRET